MVSLLVCTREENEIKKRNGDFRTSELLKPGKAVSGDRLACLVQPKLCGPWERFELVCVAEGKVAFRRSNSQKLLRAWPGGSVKCDGNSLGRWETFEIEFAFRKEFALGNADNCFRLKTAHGTYLANDELIQHIQADSDSEDAAAIFCFAKRPTNFLKPDELRASCVKAALKPS